MDWLQQLMAILGQLGQQGGQSTHPQHPQGGSMAPQGSRRGSNQAYFGQGGMWTPQSEQMMHQFEMWGLNPGGGTLGNNDMGYGQMANYGFGGYYRGAPLQSYYGAPANVGNIGWLHGGNPSQGQSPTQAPSWGAQNWIAQFQQDLANQAANGGTPYGQQTPGMIFGNTSGAQYHGGGPGMMNFLTESQGLSGMDQMFRGGGGGGDYAGIGASGAGRYDV